MNSPQQYELKIGVHHHPSLKTTQLIEFLENQTNQFLASELPQSLMIRQSFIAACQILNNQLEIDFNQYVGLIILYSSSSLETFNYAKSCIPSPDKLSDLFLMFVQMDNTQKKLNVVGTDGEELCNQSGLLFVRLSLYNSEDLVANLNRSLYLLIENYYYPNEEERNHRNLDIQDLPNEYVLNYSDSENKIIATRQEKYDVMGMIEKATLSRESRHKEIAQDQQAIDQSIENVEKVLNNINNHIKQKLQSNWFTTLKDSLYKPIEKKSNTFNKIKLTQQFLQEPSSNLKQSSLKKKQHQESIFSSKYNIIVQQQLKRLQSSLIKLVIIFQNNQSAEIEVYENSNFDQLALSVLKKLNINETQANIKKMRDKIKGMVETYIKQLSKKTKSIERQRIYQRSYLAVLKK